MFSGCVKLTQAPILSKTESIATLADSCYASMFKGCTSLTEAPELLSTILKSSCYASMFYGCTALTEAPELPATKLKYLCYAYMFYGCTSLNKIHVYFDTWDDNPLKYWLTGVNEVGKFYSESEELQYNQNYVPEGWEWFGADSSSSNNVHSYAVNYSNI
jgi:hypothetical protein